MSSLKIKLTAILLLTLLLVTVVHAQEAQLSIPSLEIDTEVVPLVIRKMPHGTTWDTSRLSQKVGYFTGTAWFGQGSNIVLGAHSEGANRHPDVFYELDEIRVGDLIQVSADGTDFKYVVVSMESVNPSNLQSILPTDFEQLTLITCDVGSFDGATYQQRLIVRAVPA